MERVIDPENPTDDAPNEVVADIEQGGGDGQFRAVPGARIQCLTCRQDFDAHTVDAERVRRLEGASDPADELILVPITCPNCGASGVLSISYGPQASPEEADVLRATERDRHG
jgi:hypothetical protein